MPKIHEQLTDGSKWSQGRMRRDAAGVPVDEYRPGEVASRCLVGWVDDTYGIDNRFEYTRRITRELGIEPKVAEEELIMRDHRYARQVTIWNDADGRTFEEVRDLCRRLDI